VFEGKKTGGTGDSPKRGLNPQKAGRGVEAPPRLHKKEEKNSKRWLGGGGTRGFTDPFEGRYQTGGSGETGIKKNYVR